METKNEKKVRISVKYALNEKGCEASVMVELCPELFRSHYEVFGERMEAVWGQSPTGDNQLRFKIRKLHAYTWEDLAKTVKDEVAEIKTTLSNICCLQTSMPAPSEEIFYFM